MGDKPQTSTKKQEARFKLWAQFLQGSIASCGAVTVSNPFEVIKTRLQIQGELMKAGVYVKAYKGMFHAITETVKREGFGVKGLQKVSNQFSPTDSKQGLFLAYPYTITMNGTRLGLYPTMKRKVWWLLSHFDLQVLFLF